MEGYWGIEGFVRGHGESWGIKGVLRGPEGSYGVIMGLSENIFTPQTPMTYHEPLGPFQSNRIHQGSLDLWGLDPTGIWGPLRTNSWLQQDLWISPQYSWDPSELFRTHQNPLGSFEPLGIPYYDLLKANIWCRKMLVFNLHVLHSLTNILAYI